MSIRFERGDSVVWRGCGEIAKRFLIEISEFSRAYGKGPFTVEQLENARPIAGLQPPHPQLLILTYNQKLLPQKFSGILLKHVS